MSSGAYHCVPLDYRLSPRSGRQHKAWGRKLQDQAKINNSAREAGDSFSNVIVLVMCSLSPANAGSKFFSPPNLKLAPQALCLRPLRGLLLLLLALTVAGAPQRTSGNVDTLLS